MSNIEKFIVRINFKKIFDETNIISSISNSFSKYGTICCIKSPYDYWKQPEQKQILFEVVIFENNNFGFVCKDLSKEWDVLTNNEAIWSSENKEKKKSFILPCITWVHLEMD